MKDLFYLTKTQIAMSDKYPFTLDQMKDFIAKKNSNGLKKCIIYIGKTLYIRTDLFEQWINTHFIKTENGIEMESFLEKKCAPSLQLSAHQNKLIRSATDHPS